MGLSFLIALTATEILADEKFQLIQQNKNNVELSIQTKDNGYWRTSQSSQKAEYYTVGVKARFCIKSDKDAYATIWNRYEKQTPIQIVPQKGLPKEYKQYLTADEKAIQLRKGKNVCIGDFTLNQAFIGTHRLWVQWEEEKGDLINESDISSFSKSIGNIPSIPERNLSNQQKAELQRVQKKGMVTLLYRVKSK